MKKFLMCKPTHFEVSYVINPWMAGNQGRVDRRRAAQQWESLHTVLSSRATISLIEPVAGLPDMVFTANGGFVCRNREVIVSSFFHPERQGESQYFARFFEDAGYRFEHLPGGIKFEGAGDALYDSAGRIWMGYGHRSEARAINEVAAITRTETHGLTLIDPKWYHLDTAFCPLSNGYVLAYEKAFSPESATEIRRNFGEAIIWVSDEDAHDFACNAVNVGSDVILHRASSQLKAALTGKGFSVIEVDVSEFMKAGGACKCLTLEI